MKKALLSLLSVLFLIGCSKPEIDIWTAAREGDVKAMEYHLDNGTDVNAPDKVGRVPLHHAIMAKQIDMIQFLIDRGADVNAKKTSGRTPLDTAAGEIAELLRQNGGKRTLHGIVIAEDTEALRDYISSGEDVNITDGKKRSALFLAKTHEIAELLLDAGTKVDTKDAKGLTALNYAIDDERTDVIKTLIKHGADATQKGALTDAVQSSQDEIINLLLESGTNKNVEELNEALFIVIGRFSGVAQMMPGGLDEQDATTSTENLERIKRLLTAGADPNSRQTGNQLAHGGMMPPTMFNSYHAPQPKPTVLDLVLIPPPEMMELPPGIPGAPIPAQVKTVDEQQMKTKRELIFLLHEHGAKTSYELDSTSYGSLVEAIREENLDKVKEIVEAGIDLTHVYEGESPLDMANSYGTQSIVDYIKEQGGKTSVELEDISLAQQSLYAAAKIGDINLVQMHLDRGVDVNMVGSYDSVMTPLAHAAKNGHLEIVKLLIEHGANVNYGGDEEQMGKCIPLRETAMAGHLDIAKLLIEKGADVNVESGYSPLHNAVREDHPEMVKFLLSHGANVNQVTSTEPNGSAPMDLTRTPQMASILREHGAKFRNIQSAAKSGNTDEIEEFLKAGIDINEQSSWGYTPLGIAIDFGREIEFIEFLISKGAALDEHSSGHTPLQIAIKNGNLPVVELLVEKGVDINLIDKDLETSPLDFALREKQDEIAEFLRENGAKGGLGMTFTTAVQRGNIEVIKQHIAAGKDVNMEYRGWTLLGNSITGRQSSKAVIELLIENGANLDTPNRRGETPLHVAIDENHMEIAMLLISKGASVEASDKYGRTPIALIYKERSLTTQDEKLNEQKKTTTKMLIKKMSNVNQPIRSRRGMTALHHELRLWEPIQDISIIKLLIEKGANVNAKDDGGVTPLHLADTVEVATLFVAKGANVNTKDNEGRTPLHRVSNNRELASFLIKNGADVNAKSNNDWTPLDRSYGEAAALLIEKEAKHGTIYGAIFHGNIKVIKEFISTGVDLKTKNDQESLLRYSLRVSRNKVEVMKLLISEGAEINEIYGENTVLDVAIEFNLKELADFLKKKGAKTAEEISIWIAVKRGNVEAAKKHLAKGIEINGKSKNDNSLLHLVKNSEFAELLIDNGANVNSKNSNGESPLHLAAELGDAKLVTLLLDSGANINDLSGFNDVSPLDRAYEGGDKTTIQILRASGGKRGEELGTPPGFDMEDPIP